MLFTIKRYPYMFCIAGLFFVLHFVLHFLKKRMEKGGARILKKKKAPALDAGIFIEKKNPERLRIRDFSQKG